MSGKKLTQHYADNASSNTLFSIGNTDTTSVSFSVILEPVRLVAFGLQDRDKINVIRVLLPQTSSTRTACGELVSVPFVAEQPHKVGKSAVILTVETPEIVIDATGTFILTFEGQRRENVQVEKLTERVTKMIEHKMRTGA